MSDDQQSVGNMSSARTLTFVFLTIYFLIFLFLLVFKLRFDSFFFGQEDDLPINRPTGFNTDRTTYQNNVESRL